MERFWKKKKRRMVKCEQSQKAMPQGDARGAWKKKSYVVFFPSSIGKPLPPKKKSPRKGVGRRK
jgi:hypothetical protein